MSATSSSRPYRATAHNGRGGPLLAILLAVACVPGLAAGVYKWTDADGHIHYGDRPAPGTDSESLSIRAAPKPDPVQLEHAQKRDRLLRIMDEERKQKKARQAKQAKQQEQRQLACEKARKRLYDYQHASYLYDLDEKGEHVILDDNAHQKALDGAARAVAKYCD